MAAILIQIPNEEFGKIGQIVIDGALTIYDVSTLQTELLQHLKISKHILLDLSKVESCDSAGVQLICSFVKEIILQGGTISLDGYSEIAKTSFTKIGVNLEALFSERKTTI